MSDKVKIITETLSDGSKVFAVVLSESRFDCISESDAVSLADKLISALQSHLIE